MQTNTIIIISVMVGAVFLIGAILTTLWLTGIIFANDDTENKIPIQPLSDRVAVNESKTIPHFDDNPLDIFMPTAADEASMQRFLDEWLNEHPDQDMMGPRRHLFEEVVQTGDTPLPQMQVLEVPDREPNDLFGYSMDHCLDLTVIGSPGAMDGRGKVYLLNNNQEVVQILQDPTLFSMGHQVTFSQPDRGFLFVQCADRVMVYNKVEEEEAPYSFHSTIQNFPSINKLMACVKVQDKVTLWTSNINLEMMNLYELVEEASEQEAKWTAVQNHNMLAMDLSFQADLGHVWVVGVDGLSHWSRSGTRWIQNASWLESRSFTTVCNFYQDEEHYLALGRSHTEQMILVKSSEPNQIVDNIFVPGGNTGNSMFSDQILWWPEQSTCVITTPLDNSHYSRQNGSVFFYRLTPDLKLIPQLMLRQKDTRQYGTRTCILDSHRLLVSSQGKVVQVVMPSN